MNVDNCVWTVKCCVSFLQFVDNVGRTPLHIACTRGELFDTALTLLNLGASIKAYEPGMFSPQEMKCCYYGAVVPLRIMILR